VLACDPDGLSNVIIAPFEDRERTGADILRRNARQFLIPHGEGNRQQAVLILLGPHAEIDEVIPIKGGQ
jgi:hypothetical protein